MAAYYELKHTSLQLPGHVNILAALQGMPAHYIGLCNHVLTRIKPHVKQRLEI